MSNLEPVPRAPKPDWRYEELTWLSIGYGAVGGTYLAILSTNWGFAPIQDLAHLGFVFAMTLLCGLSFAQLRIGIGLLQQRPWAVKACYFTNLALLIFGGLESVLLLVGYASPFLIFSAIAAGWGGWALSMLSRSEFADELQHRQP